jgi:hypothetical protein
VAHRNCSRNWRARAFNHLVGERDYAPPGAGLELGEQA